MAIPYLLLFSLIALAAILPYPQRNKLASAVEKSEKLTHWPALPLPHYHCLLLDTA
ncbi:hypothetical protein [Rubritalea tangerina]|uniref:hypothetical protein n=1 Tax=Rubritalea tangerina TaxID=430798 RepID=UPI00360C8AD4